MLASKNRHAFDRPVKCVDYWMLIVAAEANGDRAGCLAGLATQYSIDPPRSLLYVSRRSHIPVLVQPVAASVGRIGERIGFQGVQSFQPGPP